MVRHRLRFLAPCLVVLAVAAVTAAAQDPALVASTDRPSVRENESFTYLLRAEGNLRGSPDVSAIEKDFDVLDRSTSTRVQIINGQMQQVAEWQYQLMPTHSGKFTLPPVQIGSTVSNPVELEVMPALKSDDELADIFMEVEVEPSAAYVQAQVIFTLRLFVGIGTGRATLTAPEISGGEAIVERLGEDSQYQTLRDGRTFVVRERKYAVFPQETGTLTIGPAIFEAMVIPNRGFSRVQRFRSDSVDVKVEPAVPPPPEYPNAVWLPASRLELSERWGDESESFELGIPRTRTFTIEADGLLETQLPELVIGQADGIRQYRDQPELERSTSAAGLTAHRTERFAVIAQRDGTVELPGTEVPWWNVNEKRWEVARVPPRDITVLPSSEVVVTPGGTATAPLSAEPEPLPAAPGIWPVVSALLALGWAATGLLWWRSVQSQRLRATRAAERTKSVWGMNRRLLKSLRRACAANDAAAAQHVVMEWAQLKFPKDPPNTLGAFAQRLPEQAAAAVEELEECLYGRTPRTWSGAALAAALNGLESVATTGHNKRDDDLLPLYR